VEMSQDVGVGKSTYNSLKVLYNSALGLKKYGKDWTLLKSEISSRTVVQIRTHSQKFFLKLRKLIPPKKDVMEFVKENPLSFFIDIAHGEFSEESNEHDSENSKREELNKEEHKGVTSLIDPQDAQNTDKKQLELHIRLDAPANEPSINAYPIMPSNIIALESALRGTEESMKDILDGIIQILRNDQYNIRSNNIFYWQNLWDTAFRINRALQDIKLTYQKVGCYNPNIFAQFPFRYAVQQNPNV